MKLALCTELTWKKTFMFAAPLFTPSLNTLLAPPVKTRNPVVLAEKLIVINPNALFGESEAFENALPFQASIGLGGAILTLRSLSGPPSVWTVEEETTVEAFNNGKISARAGPLMRTANSANSTAGAAARPHVRSRTW